jgi:type II secretory pathway predicted ATPase ExeA
LDSIGAMYKEYFGFTDDPFGITPDPRFFYENPIYREAFTKLSWGVAERRGLMTLIGAVGTGKTTVLRQLIAKSHPAVRWIFAEYPASTFDELLAFACRELGVQGSEAWGRLDRVSALKKALLENHRESVTTALLLDEAQQLTEETLEGVRLLSNLESAGGKALQIVLAGQPELRAKLDQPALAPLKQRITSWCRLDGLSYGEVAAYIEYRLRVAGYHGPELFGPNTVEAVGFYSGGVPRLVNVLCGDALVRAHRTSQRLISSDVIVETARDLSIGPAFEFTPSRPNVPDVSTRSPAVSGPESIRRDPPRMRSEAALPTVGGGLLKAPATRAPLREGRSGRRAVKRRWLWAVVAGLACVTAGYGALAFFQSSDSSVARDRDPAAATPATPRASGRHTEVRGTPDLSARHSSDSPTPSVTTDADQAVSLPADTEAPVPQANEAMANDRSVVQAGSPSAISGPTGDGSERGPMPQRPRQLSQTVVRRGGTIIGIARDTFAKDMYLALDLMKDLNPEIDNLNWVIAGQPLRLPQLSRNDLVYRRRDGSFSLILNSFLSPNDARTLGEVVRSRGYAVALVPRWITHDLVLTRVEIKDLVDESAVRRAWETARAATWLPDEAPVAEGQSSARP